MRSEKPDLRDVLMSHIRRYHERLARELSEDVKQEIALFLLEKLGGINEAEIAEASKNLTRDQIVEILRDFGRHLYHLQKNNLSEDQFGTYRGRSDLAPRSSEGVESDESRSSILKVDFWRDYEDVGWMRGHLGICEATIDDGVDPEGKSKLEVFRLFLDGRNTLLIGRLAKLPEKQVRAWLEESISKIRAASGLEDLNPFLIAETKNLKSSDIEKRQSERVEITLDPSISIDEIIRLYKVSRATAYRIRERAAKDPENKTWYIPDYQPKKNTP